MLHCSGSRAGRRKPRLEPSASVSYAGTPLMLPKTLLLAAVLAVSLSRADGRAPERVRSEIPYKEGTVVLVSDYQERVTRTRYHANGNVVVTYNDVTITADAVDYDEESRQGTTSGSTRFSQGGRWLTCSHAEFDFARQ